MTSTTTTRRTIPVRAQKEVISVSQTTLNKYARVGLWALPIYGLANLVGTLSSQPDYHHNFPAYARYIHTSGFLASHLVASMLGTGIGLLGFTSLLVYLATSARPRVPIAAYVTTVLGSIYMVAMFGVAAFAQPAIGKAYLAGHHDAIALNSSIYGTAANLTAAVGTLMFFVGAILFAIAIARSQSLPRNAGILFAASFPIFAIGSITGTALATVGALGEIAAAIWIAQSASRAGSSRVVTTAQEPVLAGLDA
jgi:hypothetical protein